LRSVKKEIIVGNSDATTKVKKLINKIKSSLSPLLYEQRSANFPLQELSYSLEAH